MFVILLGAFTLTWLMVLQPIFSPPTLQKVARQSCLVVSQDRTGCFPTSAKPDQIESVLGTVALDDSGLHSEAVFKQLMDIDDTINPRLAKLVVQVPEGNGWAEVEPAAVFAAAPAYRVIARYASGDESDESIVVPVLSVVPALTEGGLWPFDTLHGLWTGIFGLDWPFRTISFYTSPYVLSSMVMSRANENLSARERDRAKAIMDAHLDAAPSAATVGFVWPQRLNGPVQYACFVLFFAGIIFIVLHWVSNILPNRLLTLTKFFRLDRRLIEPETPSKATELPSSPDVEPQDAAAAAEGQEDSNPKPIPQEKPPATLVSIPAPWLRAGDRADLDRTILEMEAIREDVSRRANFLRAGAMPAFPKLDAWISGLLAMKSARSGENVPSFIAVEIEAAAERLEAHHRLLSFIVWAIPTLGFIGTVIGIGSALLATVDLQSAEIVTRLRAESRVAVEIGVAFDTTLVALALSFVLMLALHLLQHLEESMLAEEKHDTLRALVQIENILPDDPIKELRDGLAQMGLFADQIKRWTDILERRANGFRDKMDMLAEREARQRGRQQGGYGRVLIMIGIGGAVIVGLWYGDALWSLIEQLTGD